MSQREEDAPDSGAAQVGGWDLGGDTGAQGLAVNKRGTGGGRAQEEDWGSRNFELVCCKKRRRIGRWYAKTVRGTGPAAATEKPNGPRTVRVVEPSYAKCSQHTGLRPNLKLRLIC
jgi:hypothetical protein